MDIREYIYDGSEEDKRLQFFVEECQPGDVDVSSIKQMAYRKIAHEKTRMRRRRLMWVASAAAGLVVLLGISYIYRHSHVPGLHQIVAMGQGSAVMDTLTVPQGQMRTVTLADGTKITANSRTRIIYPTAFNGDSRRVEIDGQAYFEVAHDKRHPFIVEANGFEVKVLGTKFDVNSYKGARSEVALVEGSVQITSSTSSLRMKPNQVVTLHDGDIVGMREADAAASTGWRKGYIYLNGETMPQIIRRLNDYYGTSIRYDGTSPDRQFYGKLLLQKDVNAVLRSLKNQN